MSVFFALSGFLITKFLWENDNVLEFFVRRFARIVPLVLLVSVIYGLLVEGRFDTFAAINLYVLNYWHSAIVPSVGPLWSLGVEMHFYIAIGFCILFFGRRGFWLVPIAAILVTTLRISTETFSSIVTHLRVDEILSGSLLALLWLNRSHPVAQEAWALIAKLFWPFFLMWILSCWPLMEGWGYLRPYLTALMIGSVLAMPKGWQVRFLSLRGLAYVAAVSFALYVWHSPFRYGWFGAGSDLEIYLIKRPITFVAIFLLAHLSTFYFEKPMISVVKKWYKKYSIR